MKKYLMLLLLLPAFKLTAQTVVQQMVSVGSAGQVVDLDLPKPTQKGNLLIAMPGPLSAGIKVVSVTDNQGDTFKQIPGAVASADGKTLEIWYAENCREDVHELKFHMSEFARGSINAVLELSGLATYGALDGEGVHLSDGTGTPDGLQLGPSLKTSATDFIIARFVSNTPYPSGVTPSGWTYKTSYVYFPHGAPGDYQPTLTGGKGSAYSMSMAAFKVSAKTAVGTSSGESALASKAGLGARHFPH
jgi:hypothetical protein